MIIIGVGKIKNNEILNLIKEYDKRLKNKPRLIEVKDSNKNKEGHNKEKESIDILKKININNSLLIALDEHGKSLTSIQFSNIIKKEEREIIFIIGGPDGLSKKILEKTDLVINLSKMTFTHEIARLLLYEQLYRAEQIIKGTKYHRE